MVNPQSKYFGNRRTGEYIPLKMWNVHSRFLARTVWVRNGEVDLAYRALNRVLNNEEVFKTARLWERYEKPFRKRGRLCYEKAHEIYNNDMERKIKFLMRKNRANPWPWN